MEKETIFIDFWYRTEKTGNLSRCESHTYYLDRMYNRSQTNLLYKIYGDVLAYTSSCPRHWFRYDDAVVVMISLKKDVFHPSDSIRYCDLIKAYLEFIEFRGCVEIMVLTED